MATKILIAHSESAVAVTDVVDAVDCHRLASFVVRVGVYASVAFEAGRFKGLDWGQRFWIRDRGLGRTEAQHFGSKRSVRMIAVLVAVCFTLIPLIARLPQLLQQAALTELLPPPRLLPSFPTITIHLH